MRAMRSRAFPAAAAVAIMAGSAPGDIVEVEIEGKVTSAASLGQVVSATFRYNSAASETGTAISGGVTTKFYGPATLLSFVVAGEAWGPLISGTQRVRASPDLYRVEWGAFDLILEFEGPGDILADGLLPTALKLPQLTSRQGSFEDLQFNFDATSVRVVAVPLPPAAWAGLAGLGLVAAARRARKPA